MKDEEFAEIESDEITFETGLRNLCCDFTFAHVFGDEKCKDELISLLNAVLQNNPHIREIKFLNPRIIKDIKGGKGVALDIQVEADNSILLDIEMQCKNAGNLIKRTRVYQGKQAKGDLKAGQTYDDLHDQIIIWFTKYDATGNEYYLNEARPMFLATPKDAMKDAEAGTRTIIVELEKVDLNEVMKEQSREFCAWMWMFKEPDKIPEEFLAIEEVKKAMHSVNFLSHDPKTRQQYDAWLKTKNAYINEMNFNMRKAEKRGIAIGEERGKAEGKAEGIALKARETALGALDMGLTVEQAAKLSGLSVEEVNSLKKK
ncbi:MAG: Rpn family recombination-promoting nuclease/putative transposase [Holosporaceae bacterium]|nr:Rpn family recombination-promoting nuclease/putative transposase [Holosporaceae bacterium]